MATSTKLFKDLSISNDVSRNGFDKSMTTLFSAKCGEILPLMHFDCMNGDSIKIKLESISRTKQLVTSAYSRIYEYFDFFFVPYRLLGKKIPHVLAQDVNNPTIASSSSSSVSVGTYLPHISINSIRGYNPAQTANLTVPNAMRAKKNYFGFYRFILSGKLMNHLGYCWQSTDRMKVLSGITDPSSSSTPGLYDYFSINAQVSLLPIAAYNKIYYDFFRNTQWEKNIPYNYNFDYMTGVSTYVLPPLNSSYWDNETMFDLRYANYPKDLFYGLYPDSQFGDTASVDVDITSSQQYVNVSLTNEEDGIVSTYGNGASQGFNITGPGIDNGQDLVVKIDGVLANLKSNFDILEFRKARFAQKYREIMGTGKQTYKSIIQRVYGVKLPDTLTDECLYLGGHSTTINISDIDNTNLQPAVASFLDDKDTIDASSAVIRGKGFGKSNSPSFDFQPEEKGILMCVYHAAPEIDYALNAFHFDVVKVEVDDFANPIFDKLGLQEFPTYFLDNTGANNASQSVTLGWTSRYFDYKTSIGMVLGDFRESSKQWVAPLTPEIITQYSNNQSAGIRLDYRFFKVNPSILNPIFAVNSDSYVDTDQLLVKASFEVHVVRNLDYLGIPRG